MNKIYNCIDIIMKILKSKKIIKIYQLSDKTLKPTTNLLIHLAQFLRPKFGKRPRILQL